MNTIQKQTIEQCLPRYLADMKQFAQEQDVPRATGTLYSLLTLLAGYALPPEQYKQVEQVKELHLQALYGTPVNA